MGTDVNTAIAAFLAVIDEMTPEQLVIVQNRLLGETYRRMLT